MKKEKTRTAEDWKQAADDSQPIKTSFILTKGNKAKIDGVAKHLKVSRSWIINQLINNIP